MAYRALDLVFTVLILVVAAPVMAVVTLIQLTQGRPVLFRQARVGKGGMPIQIYKFRTMKPGSNFDATRARASEGALLEERSKMRVTSAYDPRITPIGTVLRATHLDELPQLLNVLKGDLSLVGVRPDTPLQEVDYPDGHWEARHRYAPGITGPDQLTRSVDIAGRIENEKQWLDQRSIALYLKYLSMTPVTILKHASF